MDLMSLWKMKMAQKICLLWHMKKWIKAWQTFRKGYIKLKEKMWPQNPSSKSLSFFCWLQDNHTCRFSLSWHWTKLDFEEEEKTAYTTINPTKIQKVSNRVQTCYKCEETCARHGFIFLYLGPAVVSISLPRLTTVIFWFAFSVHSQQKGNKQIQYSVGLPLTSPYLHFHFKRGRRQIGLLSMG
jgi:hypothetical protein